jgi:hypothetical protein
LVIGVPARSAMLVSSSSAGCARSITYLY